jgi:hypothetical protein
MESESSPNVTALSRGKDRVSIERKPHNLVAVPYYAWANRGQGEMAVWLAHDESKTHLPAEPTIASASKIRLRHPEPRRRGTCPWDRELCSANDQIEPAILRQFRGYLRIIPSEGRRRGWRDFESPSVVSGRSLAGSTTTGLPPPQPGESCTGRRRMKPVAHQAPTPFSDTFNRVSFARQDRRPASEIEGAEQFYFDNRRPATGSRVRRSLRWFEFAVIEWRGNKRRPTGGRCRPGPEFWSLPRAFLFTLHSIIRLAPVTFIEGLAQRPLSR